MSVRLLLTVKRLFADGNGACALILLAAMFAFAPAGAVAQEPDGVTIQSRWHGRGEQSRPDMTGISTLRFVTDNDFPPFNYANDVGQLIGLNVDLARALCDELRTRCIIEAVAWNKLVATLDNGKADAVIASMRIDAATRNKVLFTESYYRTPARFVVRQASPIVDTSPVKLADRRVSVAKGTAHEAYLRAFYPKIRLQTYNSVTLAREAVRTGLADAFFGDAVTTVFWLNGTASAQCCRFAGGPYMESKFFGDGVGIAVKKDNHRLARILNFGLNRLRQRGVYRDILLRYFPAGSF
jgi:polar amino acid transport system substrate-binding protein